MITVDFKAGDPPLIKRDGILIKSVSGYNKGKEIDLLDLEISRRENRIIAARGERIPIMVDEIEPNQEMAEKMRKWSGQFVTCGAKPAACLQRTTRDSIPRNARSGTLLQMP